MVGRLLIYVLVLDSAVGNDKSGSICPLKATEASSPSSVERLAKETDQVDSLNKSSTQSEPELPNSRKFCITSDDSVPHDLNISSVSAIVEECNEKPTANVVNFSVPSDLSLDSRWVILQLNSSFCIIIFYFSVLCASVSFLTIIIFLIFQQVKAACAKGVLNFWEQTRNCTGAGMH